VNAALSDITAWTSCVRERNNENSTMPVNIEGQRYYIAQHVAQQCQTNGLHFHSYASY
jgi:hypothetical protein